MRIILLIVLGGFSLAAPGQTPGEAPDQTPDQASGRIIERASGWPEHGGDSGGARFSSLDEINRDNVQELEIAWRFRTGDGEGPILEVGSYGLQGTPILLTEEAGGFLVLCSAFDKVIALDPASGQVVWSFDPEVDRKDRNAQFKCRGVTQWTDERANAPTVCHSKIFLATLDHRREATPTV